MHYLCVVACDHRADLSRVKNQYGHWVCWMSTSRKMKNTHTHTLRGGSSCFLLFSPAAQSHSRDVPKYRIFQYFSLQVTIYCTRYLVFSMLCLEIACFAVLHILHVQQFFLFMHGGHEGFVGYDFMQYVVPTNILNISRIIDLFILSDLVRRDPSFLV